jgi:queuine tRNA-ribosyltransferase
VSGNYQLVRLPNGAACVSDTAYGEVFHPKVGPVAEARSLYVEQLRLGPRLAAHGHREFVIWDVGLGAGGNALTVLRETRGSSCPIRLVSFDRTDAALAFAWEQREALGYFQGFENPVNALLASGACEFSDDSRTVSWKLCLGDFPALLKRTPLPAPDAILFDPCSPARNPEMWAASLFHDVFARLDAGRPCALATYSRSTMVRVALLLAGFHVGKGTGIGDKEETTVAANDRGLVERPLDAHWLERAFKSGSAEPLESDYRQMPLKETTKARLLAHPQFQKAHSPPSV